MKKLISGLLGVTFCFTLSAGATSLPTVTDNELSEGIVEQIDSVFENKKNIEIYDNNGNVVTDRFLDSQKQKYENHDTKSIVNDLVEQDLTIVEMEEPTVTKIETKSAEPRGLFYLYAKGTATKYYKSTITGQNTDIQVTVRAEGKYAEDDRTGKITAAYDPYIASVTLSDSSRGHLTEIDSASSSISSNKMKVTFNMQINSYMYLNPGATVYSAKVSFPMSFSATSTAAR